MFLLTPQVFFWDLAIALLIAFPFCCALCSIVWLRRQQRRYRKILGSCIALLFLLLSATVAYGSFIEPQLITVTERTVDLPVAEPLTIAVISDLHVGPLKGEAFLERVVRTVNNNLPDIILLLGDFIYTEDANLGDLRPLENLRASAGVFGVLGNHDQGQLATLSGERYFTFNRGEDIADALEALGVHMLRNENEILALGDGPLALAGIDDLWTADADLEQALQSIPEGTPTILLSHNPAIIGNPESNGADLIVSGHTHGGQIRLPFIGPIVLPPGVPRVLSRGVFSLDTGNILAITSGIGETWGRARLLSWPEVLILTVQ